MLVRALGVARGGDRTIDSQDIFHIKQVSDALFNSPTRPQDFSNNKIKAVELIFFIAKLLQ